MGKSTILMMICSSIFGLFIRKKCWKRDLLGEPPPKSSLVHILMGDLPSTPTIAIQKFDMSWWYNIYIYMESGYTKSRIYILYLHNVAYHIIWYLYHNHITYNTPLNNHLSIYLYIYTVTYHIITIYVGFNIFSNNKENTLYHYMHQTYVILYHIYRKYM